MVVAVANRGRPTGATTPCTLDRRETATLKGRRARPSPVSAKVERVRRRRRGLSKEAGGWLLRNNRNSAADRDPPTLSIARSTALPMAECAGADSEGGRRKVASDVGSGHRE